MSLASWLRTLKARFQRLTSHRSRPTGRRRCSNAGPSLERLEDRTVPSTFTVTNTLDDGSTGSLRWAINQVNADPMATAAQPDTIAFNIPTSDPGYRTDPVSGASWFTIQPASGLPEITNAVLIDGYTQAGAKTNDLSGPGQLGVAPAAPSTYGDDAVLKIELDGASAGTATGLVLRANNVTVQGLVVNRFSADGIDIDGTADVIQGNFLGTDVTGTQALGNTGADVNAFHGPNARIGWTTPMARNIISGELPGGYNAGLVLGGDNSTVQGNFIGTDVTGTRSLGNAGEGIYVITNNSLIGGPDPGAGNLISGNGDNGVFDQNSTGNTFEGNFIGTDVTGANYIGNARFGISEAGATAEKYGGPGAGNLISVNAKGGIQFGRDNNLIQGNLIGTDVTGTMNWGNGSGPGIEGAGNNNVIGGPDTNAPGQPLTGAGNVVSGNVGGIGLADISENTSGNLIAGNYVGTDITGTRAIPNFNGDVGFGPGATNNTIGGTSPAYRNILSGSTTGLGIGVYIYSQGSTGVVPSNNVVEGNYIGLDATGTVALGNNFGVVISGAINNVIGGTAPGAGNTIANNITGVMVGNPSGPDSITNGNAILGNSIYANSDVAIRFQTGVNNTFPNSNLVLTAAGSSSNGTTVSGTVTSAAGIPFRVEFFANPALDPSGSGQGQTYLGFATVTTDGSGTATFTATGLAPVPAGQVVLSATLTDLATHTTGGFCHDGVLTAAALTSSANPSVYGQLVTFTASVSGYAAGLGTPTGSVEFVDTATNTVLGTVALSGGSATLTTSALSAGTHDIKAVYGGDSSFLGTSTTVSQAVGKAHLTVTANPASKTYGQAFDPAGFSGLITGLQNGDVITASYSSAGDPAGADAAAYAISAALSDGGSGRLALDYVVDSDLSDVGTLTVNQAHLRVTANPAGKTYGQTFDPAGFSGTVSGIQNGDPITASFSSLGDPATADAGAYAISAVPSDGGSGRLALDYVVDSNLANVGTLTVNPAHLTVTAKAAGKTYGQSFDPITFTGTLSGLQNGDAITASYSSLGGPAAANVGSYAISAALSDGGSGKLALDYVVDSDLSNVGTLTVTPAHLQVSADPQSKNYGETFDPVNFTGAVSGIQNGDAITVSYHSAGDPAGADAGSYAISAVLSDGGSGKLALDYVVDSDLSDVGTLTVQQDRPMFSAVGTTVITDGTPSVKLSGALSYGSLIPTGSVTVTVDNVSQTVPIGAGGNFSATFATGSLNVGVHAVTFTYGGDKNFTAACASGSLDDTYGILALFDQTHARHAGSVLPVQLALTTVAGRDVSSAGVTVTALGITATTDTTDRVGTIDPSLLGTLTPVQSAGGSNPGNVFREQGGANPFYLYNLQIPVGLAPGTYRLYFAVQGDPLDHWVTFTVG